MSNQDMNEVAEFMKMVSEEYGVNLMVVPDHCVDTHLIISSNVVVLSRNGKAQITKNRWGNIDP